jgi:chemotaxis protein CheX
MTLSHELTLEPALGDVYAVVEEVWTTFLGSEEPIFPDSQPAPRQGGGWSAAITVSGGWEAQVTVCLTHRGALGVTARMLACGEDDCTDEDLRDALGELVNMVGGNIKSLMDGPATLSLPLVGSGDLTPGSHLVQACALDLVWRGEPVSVTVHVPPTSVPGPRGDQ